MKDIIRDMTLLQVHLQNSDLVKSMFVMRGRYARQKKRPRSEHMTCKKPVLTAIH